MHSNIPEKNTSSLGDLFVTKGMNFSLEEFTIWSDKKGNTGSHMTLHTRLNMCFYWLEIAFIHLEQTEQLHQEILKIDKSKEPELFGLLLQKEFMSGMQTIMASCVSIDAYYASVKRLVGIPNNLTDTWRKEGTARYKQVSEVLRVSSRISQEMFSQIRQILKGLFELRDRAVHPESGTDIPLPYPELGIISDWRYSAFRQSNAKIAFRNAIFITYLVTKNAKIEKAERQQDFERYCHELLSELEVFILKWNEKYGDFWGT